MRNEWLSWLGDLGVLTVSVRLFSACVSEIRISLEEEMREGNGQRVRETRQREKKRVN